MKIDNRIVLTLDAGGTNFRFSAIQQGKAIGKPARLSAAAVSLDEMLDKFIFGFQLLIDQLDENPVAISFAFPGPADYKNGIIDDLENLPLFKGGVALGQFLQNHFKLPVFINNDGDLFTLGEAIGGILPQLNLELKNADNPKRYQNLLGLTFGTGFGAGIVSKGVLFTGDNSAQAEINRMRNHLIHQTSVEDSVSIRAIKRVYSQEAHIPIDQTPDPYEIFAIGTGNAGGNVHAALKAFEQMAIAAANAAADAVTMMDGIVVIGGGLSGAHSLFLPHFVNEMNRGFTTLKGEKLYRLEVKVFNLMDEKEKTAFLRAEMKQIPIPRSDQSIAYDSSKKIGVAISQLNTSAAVALGAYIFALQMLDQK